MTLSDTAKAAMAAPETSEVYLTFVELSQDAWATPLRLVANGADIVSTGDTYTAFPSLEIMLPDEEDEGYPVLRWSAQNVGRELISQMRGLTGAVDARVFHALASTPNVIERGPLNVQMWAVEYDAQTIGGTMGLDPILEGPYGHLRMTPGTTPGLF